MIWLEPLGEEVNELSLVHAHSDVRAMITRIIESAFFIINTSFAKMRNYIKGILP